MSRCGARRKAAWKSEWSRSWPAAVPDTQPPIFLATAIDAALHAGDVQMAHFLGDMQVDKKGAIDLVTNIDVAIERWFRAMIAERFPDHVVLGEEFAETYSSDLVPKYCWVF